MGNTLALARSYNISAYDAAYLELAMREGLPSECGVAIYLLINLLS